ncbi:ribonuclease YeeF family protein [Peribacillus sp. NPDC096540]|uniref:ribonuclease YeeF family protein n=1 Tax=Peribacillus sp. NPDC096540 TaxID=3390612 RepID=UPI003D016236
MKTLEVQSLQAGLDRILDKLLQQEELIKQVDKSVNGVVSLEDSLKGNGGQSIRSFYQDCHQPFLTFFQQVIQQYETTLKSIKNDLQSVEPASNGVIRESFLQHELETGLNQAKDITAELTNETNNTMQSVSDIVALPKLQDQSFIQQVGEAKRNKEQTIEKLHTFDREQVNALDIFEQDLHSMNQYVQRIQTLFINGTLSVDTYSPNKSYDSDNPDVGSLDRYSSFCLNPRINNNGVEAGATAEAGMDWDPTPTFGLNFDQWKSQPINAAANLAVMTGTAYGASKDVRLAGKGFGATKSVKVTAQGKERVVVKLDRPELMNYNKKTYTGTNATNFPRLYKLVDPMTKMKDSFKWASNRIGYIGVGTTVAGDIVHGVQNKQTASEIAGNVTGDVAVAGASIAASALVGAKIGATAGALGGPVGFAVGTVVGAVVGIAVTTLLSDFKFMDVDHDGKSDSVGDAIKKGTTGLINKIGSWFD